MTAKISFEQAVFGSFPFWHLGYGVLARSEGCKDTWLDALKLACQRFGERPTGIGEHDCFFALRLPCGPWMIVGVFPTGCDDHGRPGSLGFHALFVSRWMYRRAGRNPFVLATALRRDWNESDWDAPLPADAVSVPVWGVGRADERVQTDPWIERIVVAITENRRVVIPSALPIDDLAQAVWRALPGRVRRRASMATWAFGNDNRFDLVALPRLSALVLDAAELILDAESEDPQSGQTHESWSPGQRLWHAETGETGKELRGTKGRRGE